MMKRLPLLLFMSCCLLTFRLPGATDRPHIILIMSDDQGGWDYGFMGNRIVQTPNLDAMAAGGVRMSRFYVSPVCTPTRANLMTGRYNYRTRAIDTYLGRAMMDPGEVTLAEALAPAGYATGIFGKWHLGDSYPLRPQDQGFQEVLVHRGGGIGQPSDPPGGEGKYTDPILFHNGEQKEFKGYCTDIYFDAAMAFLAQNHEQGRPVFIYLPTNPPHGPFDDVPEGLLKKYQGADLASTLASQVPARQGARHIDTTARVYAMEENIDSNVGRLMARLKEIGAHENTLVMYLNDNGPNGPRFVGPHRGSKASIYEGGIRSPLLAHWPKRLPAGTTVDRLSAHYDVFPTALEAAGVASPKGVKIDGESLLPAMLGKEQRGDDDRAVFLQWHRGDQPVPYRNGAVVTRRYKLLWGNFNEFAPPNHGPELYDLANDPGERRNLAAVEPEILVRLKRRYDLWFSDVSATRPDNFDPPRIHIGNAAEPETVLTRQDWRHTGKGNGWARDAVGFWLVTVEQGGGYDIRVLCSAETAPGELLIEIGTVKRTVAVPGNATEVTVPSVALKSGEQTVQAKIVHGDRSKGAHQIYLRRR
jgi:arylsulfatase A-like enzyme